MSPQIHDPMTAEQKRILSVVLVPVFMSLLAISNVNVTLPSMRVSLGATVTQIQWVLSGYTLAFGVVLVAGGRAGDVYGRARIYMAGLVLFGLGSLASGLAPGGVALDVARIVMGFGSGLLNPQTVGFIQQYFTGPARGRAFGAFGSIVGVSVAVGPLLGGGLIALLGPEWGWRVSFLVNVPIAVIALVLAVVWFPASAWVGQQPPDGTAGRRRGPDLDPLGMAVFAAGTLLIMLTFLEHERGWAIWLLPAGLLLIGAWIWWEHHYERLGGAPMVPLKLFRTRSFANGSLLIGVYFTGVTSVFVLVAMYLQEGHGASALVAALVGIPSAVFTTIGSRIAGRHVLRFGRKMVALGMAIAMIGLLGSMAVVIGHDAFGTTPWLLVGTLALMGVAQGMVVSPNTTLSLMDVPLNYAGSAGGVMQTGQRVGTAIGTAVITTIFFSVQATSGWDAAFIAGFLVIIGTVVIAVVVALLDLRGSARLAAADAPAADAAPVPGATGQTARSNR